MRFSMRARRSALAKRVKASDCTGMLAGTRAGYSRCIRGIAPGASENAGSLLK
jgi:hypothetical protein